MLPLCVRTDCYPRNKVKVIGFCFLVSVCFGRLDALDPIAYEAFKASCDLRDVMEWVLLNEQEVEKEPGQRRALSVQAALMTPVQPMLVRMLLGACSPLCSKHPILPREIW